MEPTLDRLGMPFNWCANTPRLTGDIDKSTLTNFLESVECFTQLRERSDKQIIKYALMYTLGDARELFSFYEGDNYEEFANEALDFYPDCNTRYYTRPIRAKLAPISTPLSTPPSHTPSHLECTQVHPLASAIAPIRKIRKAILAPASPEPFFVEITSASAYIEAPIVRTPAQPIYTPGEPLAKVILPQHEIHKPSITVNAPEAPLEEIVSPMVSNDLKHPSRFCVPYQEPSAASEVQYVKHFTQSSSLANSSVTDSFAHIAFFAFSDYRLPVKHPCMISPTNQVDELS
jgi:hypothetical protein